MGRSARLAAAAVLGAALVTGCGSASEQSPPSGVDGLVIPSPSLDPADFVAEVDNPWLPLAVGSVWEYDAGAGRRTRTITVTVLDETREIQGVGATTVRVTTVGRRGPVGETTAWYAQDRAGNVWALGRDGAWEAGVGGVEATLAMPARPRFGDGYWLEYVEGETESRAQVVDVDASASVPYGELTGLVETEVTSPLRPGVVESRMFARGIGLVRTFSTGNAEGDELVELVSFSPA